MDFLDLLIYYSVLFWILGNVWTAGAHIITAVIGSGVLTLAWAIAQMGWIAGPTALFAFSLITLLTSNLLADCYRAPDGTRNYVYKDAVDSYLGQILVKYNAIKITKFGNNLIYLQEE